MADIIKTVRERIPALRFIGKKYGEFGHWGEWFAGGWFDEIERAMGGCEKITAVWENGGGYVGLERRQEGAPFAYYLGMFTPAGTPVPEGFEALDFEGVDLGTCWIYGQEGAVHDTSAVPEALSKAGFTPWRDKDGALWSFENCTCPRYTTPDADGNVILDYCTMIVRA